MLRRWGVSLQQSASLDVSVDLSDSREKGAIKGRVASAYAPDISVTATSLFRPEESRSISADTVSLVSARAAIQDEIYATGTAKTQPLMDFQAGRDITILQKQVMALDSSLRELNAQFRASRVSLDSLESIIADVSDRLSTIGQLQSAHVVSTSDGLEVIIVYPDSMDLVEVLDAVVPIESEIDRIHCNVLFDFRHLPTSNFLAETFPNSRVLFER